MILAASSTPAVPTILLDVSLLALLVVVALAIVRMRSLFAVVMLQGVYSLIAAAWFTTLDAVDVAFTEAAVGAGVSTVLMLAAMLLADRNSAPVKKSRELGALAVVVLAGAAMMFAVGDLPAYGDANSPANAYVGTDYLARTATEVDIPNVVTAVLSSYRGYDTFGEVLVIFAAGLGVLLLLGLNGNAGRFRAEPRGVRLSPAPAPTGSTAKDPDIDATTLPASDAPAAAAVPAPLTTPKGPPVIRVRPSVTRASTPEEPS